MNELAIYDADGKAQKFAVVADSLLPVGKRAIREGWGEAMFHYAVEHGRAPDGDAVERCKASARQFHAAYESCLKDDHPLGKVWAAYADKMVRKARELMGEKVA